MNRYIIQKDCGIKSSHKTEKNAVIRWCKNHNNTNIKIIDSFKKDIVSIYDNIVSIVMECKCLNYKCKKCRRMVRSALVTVENLESLKNYYTDFGVCRPGSMKIIEKNFSGDKFVKNQVYDVKNKSILFMPIYGKKYIVYSWDERSVLYFDIVINELIIITREEFKKLTD